MRGKAKMHPINYKQIVQGQKMRHTATIFHRQNLLRNREPVRHQKKATAIRIDSVL